MLRATTDVMVYVFIAVIAVAAVLAILRGGFRSGAKIGIAVAAIVAVFLLKAFDAKFWGVVVMGGAVLILFFLPWLDRSPVKSIRYRGTLYKSALAMFVVVFLVLGYLGTEPTTVWGQFGFDAFFLDTKDVATWAARFCTVLYFAFFFLMPWYTARDKVLPVPERVTV